MREIKQLKLGFQNNDSGFRQNNNSVRDDTENKRNFCFGCGNLGHFLRECPQNFSKNKDNFTCFRCGHVGHTAKYCVQYGKQQTRRSMLNNNRPFPPPPGWVNEDGRP